MNSKRRIVSEEKKLKIQNLPDSLLRYNILDTLLNPYDLMKLRATSQDMKRLTQPIFDRVQNCTESHYLQNNCFLPETLQKIQKYKMKTNIDEKNSCYKYCPLYLQNPVGLYSYFHSNVPEVDNVFSK